MITAGDLYALARTKIGLNFQDGRLDDNNITAVNGFVNAGLIDLSVETDWDWLYDEETITTTAGVETYPLPRDYMRTAWISDDVNQELSQKQRRQAIQMFDKTGPPRSYFIANDSLYLTPVPSESVTLRHGYYTHLPTVDVATVAELDDEELEIPPMWWNFGALFIAKHIALAFKDYNLHQAVVSEMNEERRRLADNARRSLSPMVPATRRDW